MGKFKHNEDYICDHCEPEKWSEEMTKLSENFFEKVRDLVKEELFNNGPKKHASKLHHLDVHEATTNALVKIAVYEQIFNRQQYFDRKKIDQEMIDSMKEQYQFYLSNLIDLNNYESEIKKDDSFDSVPDRALHKKEVN